MVYAIIVAAGKGIRMKDSLRKQYILLKGRPVLSHTILAFENCLAVHKIILVIPRDDFDFCDEKILKPLSLRKEVCLIQGGKERQDSVYNALCHVKETDSIIAIHDGVRPLIDPDQIAFCIENAKEAGACILGVKAFDTLKSVLNSGYIDKTLSRDTLWFAQTPQVFKYHIIKQAHENAKKEGFIGTDDASLVERLGVPVKIVCGSKQNLKITTKDDLEYANLLFNMKGLPIEIEGLNT